MDKMDHLMAEKNNDNSKDSQKGQVTPKNIFLKSSAKHLGLLYLLNKC
jgi:hypothetical protein